VTRTRSSGRCVVERPSCRKRMDHRTVTRWPSSVTLTTVPRVPVDRRFSATASPSLKCSSGAPPPGLKDGCRDRKGLRGIHRDLSGRGSGESQIHHGPDAGSVNPWGPRWRHCQDTTACLAPSLTPASR
jgi:hypothetical protein